VTIVLARRLDSRPMSSTRTSAGRAALRSGRELLALRVLPARVAAFHWRAARAARRAGDSWGPSAAARPRELAELLALARGRTRVVELGTAVGWTAIALALADPERLVLSVDPVVHDVRSRYLGLISPQVRARIEFVQARGADAAASARWPVELLFIDSSHARGDTIAEFRAWRAHLAPDAIVAFHDYLHPGHPGVTEAIEQLGLSGERAGGTFVWRCEGSS
jgi:predicted O-methyltransferase YrrM